MAELIFKSEGFRNIFFVVNQIVTVNIIIVLFLLSVIFEIIFVFLECPQN